MKRVLVLIALLNIVSFAQAHEANISNTMVVKQGEKWLFQIRTSLTAFQYEVRTNFADTPYKTPEEFKEFSITHAKNNIAISFDERDDVILKNPYIKLGHETVLVFELIGVPEDFKTVQITNSCFKDVHRNQNSFVIMKEGFSRKQVILNNANQHTASLMANGMKLEEATIATSLTNNRTVYIGGILLLITLGIFMYKRQSKSTL